MLASPAQCIAQKPEAAHQGELALYAALTPSVRRSAARHWRSMLIQTGLAQLANGLMQGPCLSEIVENRIHTMMASPATLWCTGSRGCSSRRACTETFSQVVRHKTLKKHIHQNKPGMSCKDWCRFLASVKLRTMVSMACWRAQPGLLSRNQRLLRRPMASAVVQWTTSLIPWYPDAVVFPKRTTHTSSLSPQYL